MKVWELKALLNDLSIDCEAEVLFCDDKRNPMDNYIVADAFVIKKLVDDINWFVLSE